MRQLLLSLVTSLLAFARIAIATASTSCAASELLQVTWATSHAADPVTLAPPASDLLPAFRMAIEALPESAIVALTLSQPALLGLTVEEAGRLQPLTAKRYELIGKSPLYAKAPSALPYCFSPVKSAKGYASVYVPEGSGSKTPVILFLHGYGGSFLWYQHYLSQLFPGHIIICPAYGISTALIPQAYLAECGAAVSKQLGYAISVPSLVGLSAGGYGACRAYIASPTAYSRMICLAAYPPDETLDRFRANQRPRFLSGASEPFVTSGDFKKRLAQVQRTCPALQAAVIPDGDHFFLLTHEEKTASYLRRWILERS